MRAMVYRGAYKVMTFGHQFVGVVEEVGSSVQNPDAYAGFKGLSRVVPGARGE